ncbi:integrase [Bifidobacterium tissieri]|uniref:Integrase n=2 Tax=Bifidobacterium tissieri TaxID=1630162 RepID=A0A261FGM4_9BIFI|nr:integrase [Bifidobacterium tissieri]
MLGDWLDRWLKEFVKPRLRPKTWKTYSSVVNADIKPSIGGVRLHQLQPKHFRAMEQWITKGDPDSVPPRNPKSSGTAGSAWRTLHKALDDAVKEGIIEYNPADRATPPRVRPATRSTLSAAQARALIDAETDPMWHLMWRLSFELGMRQGERLGLTVDEVQMIDGVCCIVVRQQLQEFSEDERDFPADMSVRYLEDSAYLVPPKTNSGYRVIPLPQSLAVELLAFIKARGNLRPDDLVFVGADGKHLRRQADEEPHFAKALSNAQIEGHYVPHSARHTAATAMMQLGLNSAVRKSIMGHASVSVTDTVYTHVSTADMLKATSEIAAMLSID